VGALRLSVGQYFVCAILSFAYAFMFESQTWTLAALDGAKWSILYCGLLSVGVAYTLQVVAQRRADPTFATIIMSTESAFSALGGVIFGIDSISLIGYLGCAVIFVGILVSQISVARGSTDVSEKLE
jgi:drug/metabolite transporter (DMT)-like permease